MLDGDRGDAFQGEERRYVFIGAVGDDEIQAALARLTQLQRNALLHESLEFIGLTTASGSLGEQVFTLVGDEQLNRELNRKGRQIVEAQLKSYFVERVADVHSEG